MKTNLYFDMFVPTRILFGANRLQELHLQKLPGKKALLVISQGTSARTNGYLDLLLDEFEKAHIKAVIFDEIEANPLKDTIMKGAHIGIEQQCDFVTALGGGSVMDASKAIAAMMRNDGDLWDYMAGGTGKAQKLKEKPVPLVAVTTTAGTGSEVDPWGVISNPYTNEKIGFGGIDDLFPKLAIVDPQLMVSVPALYTAYQGFDALFHSTECLLSNGANLMSDMYASEAIRQIGEYLPSAVRSGKDLEAREHVAFANTLSGVVMTICSTTSQHSIEHAMSAYHHKLPHGAGLIMISIAYAAHLIQSYSCDERFIHMAKLLGKADASKPEDFLAALKLLQQRCGVDQLKMSDYGIREDEFMQIAVNAKETMGGLFLADRVPFTEEDIVKILQSSYR